MGLKHSGRGVSPIMLRCAPRMICVVYAHPHHGRSRANRALLDAIGAVPGAEIRRLYDLYPDFDIDVDAERAALARADAIVLQHPVYWYSMPPLAKLWLDSVWTSGWAYGAGGTALTGKRFLWAVSTGGDGSDYRPEGKHAHAFDAFVEPIRQAALFCGMRWEAPFTLLGAHRIDDAALADAAAAYRTRVTALAGGPA